MPEWQAGVGNRQYLHAVFVYYFAYLWLFAIKKEPDTANQRHFRDHPALRIPLRLFVTGYGIALDVGNIETPAGSHLKMRITIP